MDKAMQKFLNDEYKGWPKIELAILAKKAFMSMYLDNSPDDSVNYYEGWLDALDTFETWLGELKSDLEEGNA
jgi:hypothetical protein